MTFPSIVTPPSIFGTAKARKSPTTAELHTMEGQLQEEETSYLQILANLFDLKKELNDKQDLIELINQEIATKNHTLVEQEEKLIRTSLGECLDELLQAAGTIQIGRTLVAEKEKLLKTNPNTPFLIQPYVDLIETLNSSGNRGLDLKLVVSRDGFTNINYLVLPVPADFNGYSTEVIRFLEPFRRHVGEALGPEGKKFEWNKYSVFEVTEEKLVGRDAAGSFNLPEEISSRLNEEFLKDNFHFSCEIAFSKYLTVNLNSVSTSLPNEGGESIPGGRDSLLDQPQILSGPDTVEDKKGSDASPEQIDSLSGGREGEGSGTIEPGIDFIPLDDKGERIRKLLIYFLAQGYIGQNEVDLSRFTSPEGLRILNDFKASQTDLEKVGILKLQDSPKGWADSNFAIDPKYIPEIQDLINRELTPFWESLRLKLQPHMSEIG